MIRLILVLLFVAIKLAMHCEENVSTTGGHIQHILCEANSKFNVKVKFSWQTCGKNVPTSKYLPIRAGTITDNTRFEVVPTNQFGWFTARDILNRPHKNYKMLLYICIRTKHSI